MAVRIRLARGGAKKRPYYRIVAADARSPRDDHGPEQNGPTNTTRSRVSGGGGERDRHHARDPDKKG